MPSCPECGNPTPTLSISSTDLTSCPNCGAPVTNPVRCEYCESLFPQNVQKVVYQHPIGSQNSNNTGEVAGAAFVGGLIGGIFGN